MTRIGERVLYRFLIQAAMTEDKFKALLLKIRKGAVTSVSLKQWIEILTQLGGWRIEPFVGLVQMHVDNHTESKTAKEHSAIQFEHEIVKRNEVTVLPTNPQVGKRYTMDVTEPQPSWIGLFVFTFKEWQGAKGIQFTSPEGKVYEHISGRFDSPDPMLVPPYKLAPWLRKETNLLEQVSNYLGMESHEAERERAKPKTRSGSATCPCCFRNIKIKERGNQHPNIVLHGYKRPGWGEIHGRCYGVNFPPFELSTEGTEHLVKLLKKRRDSVDVFLKNLNGDNLTELFLGDPIRKVTPDDPLWSRYVADRIQEQETLREHLEEDIKLLQSLIEKWVLSPLPDKGEKIKPPPSLLT
jgi:hypothetical protein